MNHPVIPILRLEPTRQRKRATPRGRRVDPVALAEVQALLGGESRQSDLLIEHLHKIQDRYGHLSTQHLAALAQEMRLAQTEVYEVASFYHHFDVIKEGEAVTNSDDERFDNDMMLMTGELSKMLADVVEALGGEAKA